MSPNEFDRLLREKFDNEMVTFNPDQWKRLASALPKEKNRKLIYIKLGSIAAALVLLGFGFLYFNDSNNSIASVDKKEATPKASIIVSPDLKNDSPIKLNEPTAKTTISTPLKLDNLTSSTSIVKKNSTKSLHQNTISIKSLETQLAIQEPQVTHGFSETSEKFILSKHDDVVNSSNQKIKEQISNSALSKTIQIADKELEIEDVKLLASKRTSINLTGGVNYGSLNLGYMASISAKQNLSDKLFIEGSIGFLQNQEVVSSNMSSSQYSQILNNSNRGRPAKFSESPSGIYFLQLAPMVGYEIFKNLSVGAGADIQRNLEGTIDNRAIVATEYGFKMIPIWDAGVTTKAEIGLNRQLKAGIVYREGLNNLLSGTQNYYNRRYVQVQLKLKLYGK